MQVLNDLLPQLHQANLAYNQAIEPVAQLSEMDGDEKRLLAQQVRAANEQWNQGTRSRGKSKRHLISASHRKADTRRHPPSAFDGDFANTESPALAYGAVTPLATLLPILLAQFLVMTP